MEHDRLAPEQTSQAAVAARGSDGLAGVVVPTAAARVLALQRSAGNQALTRWLLREPDAPAPAASGSGTPAAPAPQAPPLPRVDYVFLMGDESSDVFFKNAHTYFKGAYPKATIVPDLRSLSGIMKTIGAQPNPIGTLVIVSHAHESGSLQFKIDDNDPDNRLDYKELKEANAGGTLPQVDAKKVDASTSIVIRGCNIGRSKRMLNELDKAFGGEAKVTAPTHEQGYGPDSGTGGGTGITEKMSGYFVEEPGIPKAPRSDAQLQPLFAAKYPFVDKKQWPTILKGKTTTPDRQGPYEGTAILPSDNDAVAAFKSLLDQDYPPGDGWKPTFKGHTKSGTQHTYKFQMDRISNGAPEKKDTEYEQDEPTQAELEAMAKADLSRPEAYAFTTMTSKPGANGVKVFQIFAERSEWIVKHQPIKDAGKEVDPAPGSDPKWWGESDYTP